MTFFNYLFTKAFVRQLILALVFLILLMFVVLWWLKMSTHHDQRIKVPDLSMMTLDDSANYNPDFPKYSVIEQIPKAGKFVKENRKIYLTLNRSSYPELVIPEVVGRTRRQAEPTLIAMGFKIGKITYRPYIAIDEVLELRHEGKRIEPGMKLQKTSVIDLVLGDGEGGLKQSEKENGKNENGTSGDTNSNDDDGEEQP